MKLSIIIPVYQVEAYIERCLKSLINQNCKDFEIILVDDATKDNSMTLAKVVLQDMDIAAKYLKHESNKGLSAARNTGIKAAEGDYLLFVDSDDALSDGAIASFVEQIDKTGADCIVGNYRVVSDTNEYVSKRYSTPKICDTPSSIREAYSRGDIPIMAWNKCVRRSVVIDKSLYFKEGIYHEDELWTFLLVNEVKSLVLSGIPSYVYYVREGSIMTNTKYELKLSSEQDIYNEMLSYIETNKLDDANILMSMDAFAFQRYKNIFKNVSLSQEVAKSYFHKLRQIQKRGRRSSGKLGQLMKIFLWLPEFVAYNTMKIIMKNY